jgi:hypothetical protein
VPHGLGMTEAPGTVGLAGAVDLVGVVALQVRLVLPRGSCLVQCTSSPAGITWMNEIH